MANNYTFLDAYSSVQTANTIDVGGAQQPLVQVAGSVLTNPSPASVQVIGTLPPTSVSGVGVFNVNPTGNGSIIAQLTNSSVTALQGTNPWFVQLTSGSIATSGGTTGNSSVLVLNNPLVITGSVQGAGGGTQYLESAVQSSVTGTAIIFRSSDSSSVLTTVSPSQPLPITVTAGTRISSISGTVFTDAVSSVGAAQLGTWRVSVVGGVSILGGSVSLAPTSVATLQGTNPWFVQTVGSVLNQYREDTAATSMMGNAIAFRISDSTSMLSIVGPLHPLPIVGSVSGTVTTSANPASVQVLGGTNVIGSVAALQGTNPWVIGNSSVQVVGVQPAHSVAALQGTNPWVIGNSSVMLTAGTNTVGSVAVLQGTNPWQVNQVGNASIYTIPYNEQRTSIISQGSTVNAGDVASVLVFAAAGASTRNYITDIAISNTGSVATLITFTEGGASIIGKTIAPATGGSNIISLSTPWRNQKQNQPVNLVVGTASSTVHYTVTGYMAP